MNKTHSRLTQSLNIILHTEYDDDRPVYLVGNFNGWIPEMEEYRMSKKGIGEYNYTFKNTKDLPDTLNFKFTKGDWSEVEIDIYGNKTPNRQVQKDSGITKQNVFRWRNNWSPYKEEFLPDIHLVDEAFYLPQLDKHRKIWALTPHDYETSGKSYPVLYLHDAQNLFNEKAPFGNWEIDKKLALLADYGWGDLIVVAVEHGEEDRLLEYSINNPFYGPGDGKKYIRFITDTLKPYIDKNYRTLPDRENTGMGGSSLGGLISLFAGTLYPEVYSKLMLFSPSLWLIPEMKIALLPYSNPYKTRIYLYGGANESETMVPLINELKEKLEEMEGPHATIDFRVSINPEGHHSEKYWSIEFPKAIEWLYFDEGEVDTSYTAKNQE